LHRKKVSKTWQHWREHVLLLPGAPKDALMGDIHSMVDGVDTPVHLVVDGVHLARRVWQKAHGLEIAGSNLVGGHL